jgi:phenylalanyl-tRNA synthetase alpha chain
LTITWTETQLRRLNELDATAAELGKTFENESLREQAYQQLEKKQVTRQRRRLKEFRENHMRPALCQLESKLVDVLVNILA